MKKILVPTDFSECAEAASQVALAVAKKSGAEIYYLHLHTDDSDVSHVPKAGSPKKFPDERRSEVGMTKAALEKLVTDAEKMGVTAHQELAINKIDGRLEDYIKPFGIDLVVMGSNGARGLKEIFIGSNTQRLIWNSSAPVLVIKSKPEKFEVKDLVFVSNFKSEYSTPTEHVVEIIRLWQAQLHLLYVNTPFHFRETNEVLADMKRFMQPFKGITYIPHIFDAHDDERGIHQFVKANKVDLIALTTYGRTGFMALTHGIAECLINHERIPVLVVNMGAEQETETVSDEKNPLSNQFF
jgi:nucleotide-binding universal stress UspA family protein